MIPFEAPGLAVRLGDGDGEGLARGQIGQAVGAQAIVFSGGIGENSPEIRERVCQGLDWLGIKLDAGKNIALGRGGEGDVAGAGARLRLFVIPTDEELVIARATRAVLAEADTTDARVV